VSFDFQAAYDELNPADDDYRFYAAYAASAGVSRAVDLGCGTGTLARMLASGGITVTGVDPDPDMLRVARAKDPDGRVDWRLGYSDAIEPGSADLAVMSGHVTGHATVTRDVLAFRGVPALRATLEHAGFDVQHVYGDWDQTSPAADSPELIVIARRP
jgi:SAM-dependent methyltransferase